MSLRLERSETPRYKASGTSQHSTEYLLTHYIVNHCQSVDDCKYAFPAFLFKMNKSYNFITFQSNSDMRKKVRKKKKSKKEPIPFIING